jgi:hypothetical protein
MRYRASKDEINTFFDKGAYRGHTTCMSPVKTAKRHAQIRADFLSKKSAAVECKVSAMHECEVDDSICDQESQVLGQ